MKGSGLTIGDWVKVKTDFEEQPFKICVISLDWVTQDSEAKLSFNISDLEPITLTEEILKANRFRYKKLDNEWWHYEQFPISDFQIGYEDEDDMRVIINFDTTNIRVNYVHELQHALRLCGLNDLADNFKLQA